MRAHLGMQTNEDLASQVGEQHIASVNAAALKVQQECGWVNALRRTTITIEAEQDTINYPADSRPGSIRGMAVYEDGQYYPMPSRIIPAQADTDQQLAEGQPKLKGYCSRPRYYQQRDQIHVWPRSDKQYPIRIEYLARVDLPDEETVSIVDAQLIIYAAASMIATQMADKDQAAYFAGLYQDRMQSLRGWQSAGTEFAMDTEADMAEGEFSLDNQFPRWDRSATPPGSNTGPQA